MAINQEKKKGQETKQIAKQIKLKVESNLWWHKAQNEPLTEGRKGKVDPREHLPVSTRQSDISIP